MIVLDSVMHGRSSFGMTCVSLVVVTTVDLTNVATLVTRASAHVARLVCILRLPATRFELLVRDGHVSGHMLGGGGGRFEANHLRGWN